MNKSVELSVNGRDSDDESNSDEMSTQWYCHDDNIAVVLH